jgi:coproporphyrinogen III oxidase
MEINRQNIAEWLENLQDTICKSLEKSDGKAKFIEDNWRRTQGGGGRTRIMRDGNVIEKGGVLFSAVHGEAPDFLLKEKEHAIAATSVEKPQFFATGVSIVIHPQNPFVPIIHMNIRYFELGDKTKWLGGGIDLTPHYVDADDAKFFHSSLKKVCDKHDPSYYKKFKTWADDYFYLKHRGETRGIGGIFFDRLQADKHRSFEQLLAFWKEVGECFAPVYTALIDKNRRRAYAENNKQWQLLRRGRYVEFNLLYDKGTKFGLESEGRVESILMSLPKLAGWEYDHKPESGSAEEQTLQLLKKDVNWV